MNKLHQRGSINEAFSEYECVNCGRTAVNNQYMFAERGKTRKHTVFVLSQKLDTKTLLLSAILLEFYVFFLTLNQMKNLSDHCPTFTLLTFLT